MTSPSWRVMVECAVMETSQATAVLEEILDPVTKCLSVEVAQSLANLRASPAAQSRIAELAEKCNEGALTAAERAEYETYVRATDLIAVLQAKARRFLARQKTA